MSAYGRDVRTVGAIGRRPEQIPFGFTYSMGRGRACSGHLDYRGAVPSYRGRRDKPWDKPGDDKISSYFRRAAEDARLSARARFDSAFVSIGSEFIGLFRRTAATPARP